MQQVQLNVENSFSSSTQNNIEIGHTMYNRVFNRLLKQGKSIGKVLPIYLKVWKIEKTLGIVTLNNSGTYSLFLEIPTESIWFDHITFWDISKDKHHMTEVTETWNKKVLPISQQKLSNDTLYIASFAIQDYSLLKAIPKTIIYPEIPIEKFEEIQWSFFTQWKIEWATILELNWDKWVICIQFFLIPKNIDYKRMEIFPDPFIQIQSNFDFQQVKEIYNCIIPHDKAIAYDLGIVSFLYQGTINYPMFFSFAVQQAGYYNHLKINLKRKSVQEYHNKYSCVDFSRRSL